MTLHMSLLGKEQQKQQKELFYFYFTFTVSGFQELVGMCSSSGRPNIMVRESDISFLHPRPESLRKVHVKFEERLGDDEHRGEWDLFG